MYRAHLPTAVKYRLVRYLVVGALTLGVVTVGERTYTSGEDVVRPLVVSGMTVSGKIPGRTAIPPGEYEIIWSYSPRFKRHTLELLRVPGFTGIRIHPGNTELDTEGCILLGMSAADGHLVASRKAVAEFEAQARSDLARGRVSIIVEAVEPLPAVSVE